MTVPELQHALTVEREDYVPRALALMEEEFARRTEAAPYRGGSFPTSPARVAAPRTRWWHIWVALLASGSVVSVIVSLFFQGLSGSLVPRVVWALIIVPIALHLRSKGLGRTDARDIPPREGEGPAGLPPAWRIQLASDVIHNCLSLELLDANGKQRAAVTRFDSDNKVVVTAGEDAPPADVLEWLRQEAVRRLGTFEDGSPLPDLRDWPVTGPADWRPPPR